MRSLAPSVRKIVYRSAVLSLFALPALLVPAVARAEFDSDRDLVSDSADAFPCDSDATSVIFAPAQGEHGFMLFEDQWPNDSDLDFNDVALAYNYIFQVNQAGQVVRVKATFNALAVGGVFNNGIGLRIPVPSQNVASVTKTVGNRAPVALTPQAADNQLTVRLSNNVRELFRDAAGPINSDPTQAPMQGETLVLEIAFNTPVTLDTGAAPFDLYIFRTEHASLEIHRPEYAGTTAMDQSLFGTGHDASSISRHYVDRQGLPYALNLPTITDWPREGKAISTIFPSIVDFASSGGRSHQDFYQTGTVAQNMYVPAGGMARPLPHFIGPDHVPAETGCVQAWGLAVDFGSSRNQYAYGSVMDVAGDVYVTGYIRGSLLGETNAGGLDLYVAKYDGRTGSELWAHQFGGSADETGRDIAIDSNGDIYVTGESRSSFGQQSNAGGADALLMKLNSQGQLQWTRLLGAAGQDTGYGVAIDPSGYVYIGGGTTSIALPGATAPGNGPSSFLAKYSLTGDRLWTRQFLTDLDDPSDYNYTLDIAVDPLTGGVYSVGAERRYHRSPVASENQFVTKHSGDGSLLFVQHIGDYGYNNGLGDHRYGYAYGVSADNFEGAAYVTGHWYGGTTNTKWGDWARTPGDTSADATLVKIDSTSGDVLWSYVLASSDGKDDFGEAVSSTVVFTGRTLGTLPGQVNQGGTDYFVAAYDLLGNSRFYKQDGTAATDMGAVAAILSNPSVHDDAELFVVTNTTGALGGPDQGHYDVGIADYRYVSGEKTSWVIASKLGWKVGNWTDCSASCGGGTQSRSVQCVRADGQAVTDSYCPETKPAISQTCNPQACFTYAWTAGTYGACSASCGGGTQTRAVYCQRSDGAQVADNFCTGAKPGTTQACNTQTCYTYSWYAGVSSSCSRSCGGGTQSRTVYCLRSDGAQVADSYCTGTKPDTWQACNTQSCSDAGLPSNWDGSCLNVRNSGASSGSGVYNLDPDGSSGSLTPFSAYCDMTGDGGGWTLALRAQSSGSAFLFDSAYWSNTTLLNTGNTDPTYNQDAKYASFTTLAGTQIRGCLRYYGGSTYACKVYTLPSARTLLALFRDTPIGSNYTGRGLTFSESDPYSWLGMWGRGGTSWSYGYVPAGINLYDDCTSYAHAGSVRFGILGNNETNVCSNDDGTGFGSRNWYGPEFGAGAALSSGASVGTQGTIWIR